MRTSAFAAALPNRTKPLSSAKSFTTQSNRATSTSLASISRRTPLADNRLPGLSRRSLGDGGADLIRRHRQFFDESQAVLRVARFFVKLMRFGSSQMRVHRDTPDVFRREIVFGRCNEQTANTVSADLLSHYQRQNSSPRIVVLVAVTRKRSDHPANLARFHRHKRCVILV